MAGCAPADYGWPVERILVIGASGHAEIVVDSVEKEGRYRLAGLVDDYLAPGEERFGYPVLGTHQDIPRLMAEEGIVGGLVGIGDNWTRRRIWKDVRRLAPDFRFVSVIHPDAQVGRGASIGEGSLLMVGAILNPGARMGRNCVISTNASLDHDASMSDHASLSGKVATGGNVRIGACTAVMLDVTIAHGITIGEHTVVGAGSLVLHDLPGRCVAYGTPARVIRRRKPGDAYL